MTQHLDKSYNCDFEVWMSANNMSFEWIDTEVVEIHGFGDMFVIDTDSIDKVLSLKDDKLILNLGEDQDELVNEGVGYAAFKFGERFYYTDLSSEFSLTPLKYLGKFKKLHYQDYTNLGIHSQFELLEGSNDFKTWCKKAKFLGHKYLGICDKNTLAGTLAFQGACDKAGISPVFGYSTTLRYKDNDIGCKLYCQSEDSWGNMLRIQKAVGVDNYLDPHIGLNKLLESARGLVFVFEKTTSALIDNELIESLNGVFECVYYQIDLSEYKADRFDVAVLEATKFYFDNLYGEIEPVLLPDTYYPDAVDSQTKVVLNKIAYGTAHKQSISQYYKTIDEINSEMEDLFEDQLFYKCLVERASTNSIKIARNAKTRIRTDQLHAPQYEQTEEEFEQFNGDNHRLFENIIEEGFNRLVPVGEEDKYRKQLNHEKYVIESTNNVDYFLISYDEIRMVKNIGGYVGVGRGSAGGCLISYLMGIITIDPIEYGLIFERFLTPERCGLVPQKTTKIGKDVEGVELIEVLTDDGFVIELHPMSELIVLRAGDKVSVVAEDLMEGDDILLDRKNEIWDKDKIITQ